MREKQKSGPSVRAASSITDELGSRQYIEDPNRRKPHPLNLVPEESHHDATGEDDLTYFRRRPNARTRVRTAFPGEFPRKILKQGRGRTAVVIIAIERDAFGQLAKRARGLVFGDGGTA